MKKISIMVPCYNEEENVVPLSEALIAMFEKTSRSMIMKFCLLITIQEIQQG